MPHTIYTVHDRSGVCLYVGITGRPVEQRRAEHESPDPTKGSDWAKQPGLQWGIVRSGLTKGVAVDAERRLIEAWRPLHCTEHSLLAKIGRNAALAMRPNPRPSTLTKDWVGRQWVRACHGAGLWVKMPDGAIARPTLGALHPRSTDSLFIFNLYPCEGVPLSKIRARSEELTAGFRAVASEVRIIGKDVGQFIVAFDYPFPKIVEPRLVRPGATELPYCQTMPGEILTIPITPGNGQGNGCVVAGRSGSGKSTTVMTLITQALLSGRVELDLCDPKQVDLALFHGAARRVETDDGGMVDLLLDAVMEMERRYTWLQEHGFRDVIGAQDHPDCPSPRWVVVEELRDVTTSIKGCKKALEAIRRIARKGRAAGVFPLLIDLSPYVASLPGDLADNLARYIVHSTKRREQTRAATGGGEEAAPAHDLPLGDFTAYTEDPRTGEVRLVKSMLIPDDTIRSIIDHVTSTRVVNTTDTRRLPLPCPVKGTVEGGRLDAVPVASADPAGGPFGTLSATTGAGEGLLSGGGVSAGLVGSAKLGLGGADSKSELPDAPVLDKRHPLRDGKNRVTPARWVLWEQGVREPGPCGGGCGRTVSWWWRHDGHDERVGFVRDGQALERCRRCQGKVSARA